MAKLYSINGKVKGELKLPNVFSSSYRPDLIQRSVVAEQSSMRQPYGIDPRAGFKTSADYFGSRKRSYRQTINRGMSRLPREKPGGGGLGKVRRIPQSVGGHRSHPPEGKDYTKKINKKERANALNSAIAATADTTLAEKRGHVLGGLKELPLVLEDAIQGVKKASELVKIIGSIGLGGELEKRKASGGDGILIVVGKDEGICRAAGNIPGVEVSTINGLSVDMLAPGTHAGRLTIWSESALKSLGGK